MITNNLILRDLIVEKKHQLEYLLKTQKELKYLILLDPTDNDISTAYYENEVIISSKEKEIKELQDKLEEIDPAYAIERLNERNNQQNVEEEQKMSDNGIYL